MFKDAMLDDIDTMLNSEEFAVEALFSRSGSVTKVLMDKEQESETGRYVDVVTAKSSDVQGISTGDTFDIDGTVYVVSAYEPFSTGDGLTSIRVEKR